MNRFFLIILIAGGSAALYYKPWEKHAGTIQQKQAAAQKSLENARNTAQRLQTLIKEAGGGLGAGAAQVKIKETLGAYMQAQKNLAREFAAETGGDAGNAAEMAEESKRLLLEEIGTTRLGGEASASATAAEPDHPIGAGPVVSMELHGPIQQLQAIIDTLPKDAAEQSPARLAAHMYAGAMRWIKKETPRAQKYLLGYAGILFVMGLLVSVFGSLASILAHAGFGLSRACIGAVCLLSMLLWFALGRNLHADAGPVLWAGPALVLLVSAWVLKRLDFNFPVWNRVLGSFIFLLVAGIAMSLPHF